MPPFKRATRPPLQRLLDLALWAVLLFSLGRLAFPLAEQAKGFYVGWQRQRQLKAQWQEVLQRGATRPEANRPQVARQSSPTHYSDFDAKPAIKAETSKTTAVKAKPPVRLAAAKKQSDTSRKAANVQLWPLTHLISERMNLDATVVEGVSERALRDGPGHDPRSSQLGEGNCVIAAHRNTAGWWFYRLDKLRKGDRLTLETPYQVFTYRVEKVREVPETDLSVLHAKPGMKPRLTLYSCTLPKTTKRLVATATLEKVGQNPFSLP